MAIREYYGLAGRLVAQVDEHSTLMQVDSSLSGALELSNFINGVDHTYLAVYSAGAYEVVKVTAVHGDLLTVERAQSDEGSFPFPIGATVQYIVTAQAVLEQMGPAQTDVEIAGVGIAVAQEVLPNSFEITVPVPEFEGENGIEIYGTYPQMRFAYTGSEGNCEGGGTGGGGEGITEIVGEGLVTAFVNGDLGTIRVTPPVFTGGANIQVTGAWPNYTISATAGNGTVASVGVGAGLTLTGSPSVNPTISITNTGVTAGTYGGVNINARGQITTVPAGFNPVSVVEGGTNVNVSRVGHTVTVAVPNAAIGSAGAVELADETDPFDPDDNTRAATPALVAAALAGAEHTSLAGNSSFSPESAAEYSNPIGSTSQALLLEAGESALVIAEVAALNTTAPTDPPLFGIAVFTSSGLLHGNRKFRQNQQQISFVINGPFNNTVTLTTTDLTTDATLLSHSMSVLKM